MSGKGWGLALVLAGASPLEPLAAAASTESPSIEPIVVTGRKATEKPSFETRHQLSAGEIERIDATAADAIVRRLPSVHVPVNSRGEAIAFLRNAGERQVVVFYEGASINVPWDNRLDLSLLPAGLIGSARSASGPLAPHYGVSALGAISLSPQDESAAKATVGTGDLRAGDVTLATGPLVLGGGASRRHGEPYANDGELVCSQPRDDVRTNTDQKLANVFARLSGKLGSHELGLTAFQVWGEKGIAPEGNRASGARFWRYPRVSHSLIVGNARSELGADTRLESTIWLQRFGQTISNYANADYKRITLQQIDRDETWGLRELATHRLGQATLVGSFSLLRSTHRQRDVTFSAGVPPAVRPRALLYSQRNGSLGVEVKYEFSPKLLADVGLGYDVIDYTRTGDKPEVEAVAGWAGRAGVMYERGDGWRFRTAIGRKLRTPTLRERFGEAIRRFLINPDLKPERIVTYEIGADWRGPSGEFFVIPFYQSVKDTIDQRNVGSLRQRINLSGSYVWGIEAGGKWRLNDRLALSGHTTWTRVRRKDPAANGINRIAEKPSLLARGRVDYQHPVGLSAMLEVEHVGRAYSADPAGKLIPLKRSISFSGRLAYGFKLGRRPFELSLQGDNLTDTVIEPQLGLPAPGRSVRVGLRIRE